MENEIKRGRGRPKKFDYPSTLICNVTKQEVKITYPVYKKLLEEFGSKDEVVAKFICKEAKSHISETETQSIDPAPPVRHLIFDANSKPVSTHVMPLGDICYNPTYFLDNERHCTGCIFGDRCECHLKNFDIGKNKSKKLV